MLNKEPNGLLQTSTNVENSGEKKEKRTSNPQPKTKWNKEMYLKI